MKKFIFLFLIIFANIYAQSEYTIELKKIYCEWVSAAAFVDSVETIIRDSNGNVIPDSNNFYYEYHVTTFTNPPNTDIFGGLGLNKTFEDNDQNFIQTWYVVVKDPTQHIIFGTSNTVPFQMQTEPGKSKQIIFQSLKSNGTPELGVNLDHWMYVVDLWNLNFSRFLTVNHDEVLRASPSFLTSNNDKFNYWNSDQADVLNHNHFYYSNSNTEYLTANYKTSVNATIRAKLDDLYLDVIKFKDPWLRDYNEAPFGLRNQGLDALPQPLANIDNNLAINSEHQGVLLNQDYNIPGQPYYSINIPSSIYLPQTGQTHNIYLQNWNVTGASLQYPNSLTTDGILHLIYESMGHIFYERSTNNGSTWFLANNGKPLDINGGKLPAMDNRGNDVAIVWQEKYGGGAVEIKVAYFEGYLMYPYYPKTVFIDGEQSYSQNLNPVIAYDYQGRATVAWENKSNSTGYPILPIGIVVAYGPLGRAYSFDPPEWTTLYAAAIPSTNSNCVNPTISAAKNPTDQYNMVYNLAWQYNQSTNFSSINSCRIAANSGGVTVSSFSTPSTGAGFWLNYNSSIVSMNDNTARLVWTGYAPWYGYRTVYNYNNTSGTWSSSIINMGSNVLQSNINSTDDGKFVIGWVQNNISLTNNLVKSDNIYNIKNFKTTGNNLQINNASSYNTMYAMTFQNQTAPYSFKLSANVSTFLKTNSLTVSKGRAEVITHNGTDYCFGIGDIVADGQSIDFVSLNSLKTLPDEVTLNYFLQTDDFDIMDNSNITFSLFHGMINPHDTTQLINSLGDNDYINVKVVIVDAENNKVLAQIGNYVIKKGESFLPDITNYKFNPAGIGSRKVRLELMLDNNIQMYYTINDFFGNGSSLSFSKSNIREISLNENEIITTYALEQNYPNPFNPSTTITYQIPKSGSVTLKIFDILGNEVKSIVNEQKEKGKYTVQFDASSLASGVYIYKIQAGSFTASKKLMLLK